MGKVCRNGVVTLQCYVLKFIVGVLKGGLQQILSEPSLSGLVQGTVTARWNHGPISACRKRYGTIKPWSFSTKNWQWGSWSARWLVWHSITFGDWSSANAVSRTLDLKPGTLFPVKFRIWWQRHFQEKTENVFLIEYVISAPWQLNLGVRVVQGEFVHFLQAVLCCTFEIMICRPQRPRRSTRVVDSFWLPQLPRVWSDHLE